MDENNANEEQPLMGQHKTNFITKILEPWNSEDVAPKSVTVKNYGMGILFSGMKIFTLIIGLYLLFGLRQFQDYNAAQGTSISKLKGFSVFSSNGTLPFLQNCNNLQEIYHTVFDSEEYSIMDDHDSFFVMTNMWITCNQSVGICGEDMTSTNNESYCENDTDCSNGTVLRNGNGPQTGTCNTQTKTCNVLAWCPVEAEEKSNEYPKISAEKFTVLIKNTVWYPTSSSSFKKSNIGDDTNLSTCMYDKDQSPGCPIFTMGQIVSMISTPQNFTELSIKGAVINFNIKWNCNLDGYSYPREDWVPVYSVTRQDNANPMYSGYNTRLIKYDYVLNGIQYRTLVKAYGIRVIVNVNGMGGEASLSSIATWLGTSLAYYGSVVTIMTLLLTYGYLNYCIGFQKMTQIKRNNNCCYNHCHCSLAAILQATLYFISSGLCCGCIYISTCCRCKVNKGTSCCSTANTLQILSWILHGIWIGPLYLLIIILSVAAFFCVFILLAIPYFMVCFLSWCGKDVEVHRKKIIDSILHYDIKHDTYAAKILKHNWDGIERYLDDNKTPTTDNEDDASPKNMNISDPVAATSTTGNKQQLNHKDTKVPDHVAITFTEVENPGCCFCIGQNS